MAESSKVCTRKYPVTDYSHTRQRLRQKEPQFDRRRHHYYYGVKRTPITKFLDIEPPAHSFHPSLIDEPPPFYGLSKTNVTDYLEPRCKRIVPGEEFYHPVIGTDVTLMLRIPPPSHPAAKPPPPIPWYGRTKTFVTDPGVDDYTEAFKAADSSRALSAERRRHRSRENSPMKSPIGSDHDILIRTPPQKFCGQEDILMRRSEEKSSPLGQSCDILMRPPQQQSSLQQTQDILLRSPQDKPSSKPPSMQGKDNVVQSSQEKTESNKASSKSSSQQGSRPSSQKGSKSSSRQGSNPSSRQGRDKKLHAENTRRNKQGNDKTMQSVLFRTQQVGNGNGKQTVVPNLLFRQ